jgi:hypothetical protein
MEVKADLAAEYVVEFETVRLFGTTKDVPAGTRVPGGELAGDQRGLEYLLRVGAVSAVAAVDQVDAVDGVDREAAPGAAVDEGLKGPKGPKAAGEGSAA